VAATPLPSDASVVTRIQATLAVARPSTGTTIARRCGRRLLAAGALAAVLTLLAVGVLGWPWHRAGSASMAGVGNWSLIRPAQDLGAVLAARRELADLAQASRTLGLALCVLGAGLAAAVGGPSLAVLGFVDLVVAIAMVGAIEGLRAAR